MDYILTVFSLDIRLTWIVIFADQKTYQKYNVRAKCCCDCTMHMHCTVHTFQISFYVLLLCFPFFPSKASWKCAVPSCINYVNVKKNSYSNRERWAFSHKILSCGGGRIWTHNLRFNLPWELPGNPVPLFDLLQKIRAKLLSLPRMLLFEPVRGSRQAGRLAMPCRSARQASVY